MFLEKLNIELPYDPATLLLGIYTKKKCLNQKKYMYPNAHGCCCLGAKCCLIISRHHGLYITWRGTLPMGFPRQEYWSEKKKHTGVGCHFLPQGTVPSQGLNLSLNCTWILYTLPGKPTAMLIATLFTVSKMWKQLKCPSTGTDNEDVVYTHSGIAVNFLYFLGLCWVFVVVCWLL